MTKLTEKAVYLNLEDGRFHLVDHIEGAAAFCQVYTDASLTNLEAEYSTAIWDDGSMEDYHLAGSLTPYVKE